MRDVLFEAVFPDSANAIAHVEGCLPEELTAVLELSKAQHEPGSFVDDALTDRHTDQLFRIPSRQESGNRGRELLLYLVFEHENDPYAMVPYRALCYSMRVWEYWLRRHADPGRFPPILPLILRRSGQKETTPSKPSERPGERWTVDSITPATMATMGAFVPELPVQPNGSEKGCGDERLWGRRLWGRISNSSIRLAVGTGAAGADVGPVRR
jgi:hypothetical protein